MRPRRPTGARESVPQGHLKVAHYKVVGRVFSKATRSARGTIDWLLALGRPYASQGLTVRSCRRDGAIFNAFSHHFVVGYYQMSLRDQVLSECYLAYVDAHVPLPDPLQVSRGRGRHLGT
jgi:hypothetical protein